MIIMTFVWDFFHYWS